MSASRRLSVFEFTICFPDAVGFKELPFIESVAIGTSGSDIEYHSPTSGHFMS